MVFPSMVKMTPSSPGNALCTHASRRIDETDGQPRRVLLRDGLWPRMLDRGRVPIDHVTTAVGEGDGPVGADGAALLLLLDVVAVGVSAR